jgi:hypothetical protein
MHEESYPSHVDLVILSPNTVWSGTILLKNVAQLHKNISDHWTGSGTDQPSLPVSHCGSRRL